MKTSPSSCAPILEALEPRLAPAGIVNITTSGGVLTITGDDNPNGVIVTHVPATGEWRIDDTLGASTYNVNGVVIAAPFNIPAQNAIKVDLKEGNDRFEFRPTPSPSGLLLSGGIDIKLGSGNDYLELGFVSGYTMIVGGPVSIDGGDGNDTLSVWMDATFAKTVKIMAGSGNDTLKFDGSAAEQVYQKGLTIDMGIGTDTLTFQPQRMSVTGPLNIKMGGGDSLGQAIHFNSSFNTFDGPVSIAVTAGNATLNLGNNTTDQLRFGSLKIATGNGNDSVNFGGQIHTSAAISLDLKNGTNATNFLANSALFGTSLSIKGGLNGDTVSLASNYNLILSSNLLLTLGTGTNTISAIAGSNITAGSLKFTGLGGTDILVFEGQNLYLTGSLTTSLGAGTNIVSLASTSTTFIGAGLSYMGGMDTDQIVFNSPNTRINGNLVIKGGNGSNTMAFQGAAMHIGAGINYMGGTGNDVIDISNTELSVMKTVSFKAGGNAGTDVLYLRPTTGSVGAILYSGGNSGTDAFLLGDSDATSTTHFTVLGNVSYNSGAGSNQAVFTDTYIQGKVNIKTTSKSTESDFIYFKQSVFHGAVNITLGAGLSGTQIDNSTFRANVLINSGAGNDSVLLGTLAGSTNKNYWYGTVKILGGAGTDTIRLGLTIPPDANAGNIFHQNVIADGGTDVDIFTTGGTSYNAGSTLTQLNFP